MKGLGGGDQGARGGAQCCKGGAPKKTVPPLNALVRPWGGGHLSVKNQHYCYSE